MHDITQSFHFLHRLPTVSLHFVIDFFFCNIICLILLPEVPITISTLSREKILAETIPGTLKTLPRISLEIAAFSV